MISLLSQNTPVCLLNYIPRFSITIYTHTSRQVDSREDGLYGERDGVNNVLILNERASL